MNLAEELWTPLAPLPSTNMGIQSPILAGPGSYCEWPLKVRKSCAPTGFRPWDDTQASLGSVCVLQ